ncbi:Spindle and kinetochore-associated protein 1-like protein [Auxenochlorella protothecoides]|uniref:Spindle and kinetochore-associated protein 1-like protein n=1 Tax=Auxenochlorella protothecoides TaxID=3075 RepID=A0A087SE49_AUXPR|nr:Spindle and kinetochore-associated protein 1-like protein [Auxenochlorella protothecoides]KFM24003.1 Spindle and kinetochore-associated protein 1-like protein [Auxenochlorella protothecoides]
MATGVLEQVVLAFSAQISELQQATLLRADDASAALYKDDLVALESRVRELEGRVRGVREQLARDRAALPAAQAVIRAATLQQRQLEHVEACLPTFLPSLPPTPPVHGGGGDTVHAEPARRPRAPGQENCAEPNAVPRYISSAELESLSSYMRGRLTADRVNQSLDELAAHAARNAALVLAARRGRVAGADKRHGMWLAYSVAVMEGGIKEPLRGQRWVLESDLKTGNALKLDKSGKAILTVLRHLGRISEARVSVEGTTLLAILLQD